MKLNQIKLFTLALALAFIAPGCGKQEAASDGTAKPAAGKKLKLAFVSNNAATFWTIARTGCEAAAKELGNVEVDFRIPSDGQAGTQQQIIDDLVARGVDGIAVSPISPKNQTATRFASISTSSSRTSAIRCDRCGGRPASR